VQRDSRKGEGEQGNRQEKEGMREEGTEREKKEEG
jgi:hypothetical protein